MESTIDKKKNYSPKIFIHIYSACKLMAKQKVALECLSYHATAAQDQTQKLASEPVKSAEEYKLYSFKFIGRWIMLMIIGYTMDIYI